MGMRGEGDLRGRKLLLLLAALAAMALIAVGCGDDDDGGDEAGGGDTAAEEGGTIKVGFLSDCEGDFGSFFRGARTNTSKPRAADSKALRAQSQRARNSGGQFRARQLAPKAADSFLSGSQ